MPTISKEIDTLNKDIKTQLDGLNSQQHQAENNIRDDLKALQNQLARVQDVQVLIKDQNQAAVDAQRKLQDQLRHTVQNLGTYSRNQEEVLRQREAVGAVEHPAGQGGQGRNISEVVRAVLQLIGNGIAGAIGGMIVRRYGSNGCENECSDGKSNGPDGGCDSARDTKTPTVEHKSKSLNYQE